MIAFVWILSALVSLPPLVGWKKQRTDEQPPQCDVSDDIGYVLLVTKTLIRALLSP